MQCVDEEYAKKLLEYSVFSVNKAKDEIKREKKPKKNFMNRTKSVKYDSNINEKLGNISKIQLRKSFSCSKDEDSCSYYKGKNSSYKIVDLTLKMKEEEIQKAYATEKLNKLDSLKSKFEQLVNTEEINDDNIPSTSEFKLDFYENKTNNYASRLEKLFHTNKIEEELYESEGINQTDYITIDKINYEDYNCVNNIQLDLDD